MWIYNHNKEINYGDEIILKCFYEEIRKSDKIHWDT